MLGWTVTGAAMLLACAAAPTNAQAPAKRHYSSGDLASVRAWALGAPDLSIGLLEGADEYLFSGLGSIQVLEGGTIAVTNWAPPEVRLYSASGQHLRSLGHQGSGPGEFIQLTKLFRLGPDSVVTWDIAQSRGSVYAASGTYGRQVRLGGARVRMSLIGAFRDGSLLLSATSMIRNASGQPVRQAYGLHVANRDGELLDSVTWIPGFDVVSAGAAGYLTNPTFSAQGFAAACSGTVWTVDGSTPVLRQHDRSGRPLTESSWDPGDRTVTQQEIELYWEEYEARGDEFRESAKTRRELPTATQFPTTGRIFCDAEGLIWVQVNTRPSQRAEIWMVFESSGAMRARLEAPLGFSVREAGRGYVLGITRDEFDVERIERRRIVPRPAG